MKLSKELEHVKERFVKLKNVVEYAKNLKENGTYNDFATRLSWDIGHAAFTTREICDWYDKYGCNDSHITTLFKRALFEVFPEIKSLI